jgi:hypothetical protein
MKRRIAAAMAVVLLAMPMAGCQTLLALEPGPSAQMRATQALYVAEAAFSGASLALESAVDAGALRGRAAESARGLYGQAHEALLAARQAKAAGDYALELAKASQSAAAAGQLQAAATQGTTR